MDVFYTPHPEKTFTVSNMGGSPSGALGAAVSGPDSAYFSINDDACSGVSLAAGTSCTLDVTFAPDSGIWSATLSVSGSPGGTAPAPLTGQGFI